VVSAATSGVYDRLRPGSGAVRARIIFAEPVTSIFDTARTGAVSWPPRVVS
jgi:hypothetical protein